MAGLIGVIIVCIAALVSPAAAQPDLGTPEAVYASFREAYRTLNSDLIRAIYTEDCVYLQGGAAAIDACPTAMRGFARMFERARQDGRELAIEFRFVDRDVGTELAWDAGYYRLSSTGPEGESPPSYGKFLVVMVRKGNDWRIQADGFSPATAAAWEAAAP